MAVQKITFDRITYHTGKFEEFADFIYNFPYSQNKQKAVIVHINLRNYYYMHKDENLKECIRQNSLNILDGIGMKTGFFLRGYGLLPDLNGTDLFPLLITKLSLTTKNIFLLGTSKENIEQSFKRLSEIYPSLNICGYYNGYFSITEEEKIVELINGCKTDILIIGRGFPLQEEFSFRNKNKLHVSLIWNVAGLFDIISGEKPRAPFLLRKLRLEWLFRLILEPKRMFHRNTIAAFWSLKHIIFCNNRIR